jgi:hypothetical protein
MKKWILFLGLGLSVVGISEERITIKKESYCTDLVMSASYDNVDYYGFAKCVINGKIYYGGYGQRDMGIDTLENGALLTVHTSNTRNIGEQIEQLNRVYFKIGESILKNDDGNWEINERKLVFKDNWWNK